jgi:transglutaminase-like putative cysteine protease
MAKTAHKPKPAPLARASEPWLVACAALTLSPHAAHAPLWLSLSAGAGLAWRGLIWWRRWALPPRWLLTLLVLAGSIAVLASYRQFFGKDPGVALLIIFLTLKLLELRSVRDGLAALFLCYFLLLTHFLYEQSMEVAGVTLSALVMITAALASLAHAGRSPLAHLRLSGLMLAQALPFMLAIFLLFPRVQGPLWGLPMDAYSGLTGLSDTMSPGSISELSLSGAIAFRAKFEGDPPPQNMLYWRGPVLRHFDGRTWRAGRQTVAQGLPYEHEGRGIPYAVTLEPHNKPWLFALEMPALLPPETLISGEYQLLARTPVRTRVRYELRSHVGLTPGMDAASEILRANLQLPDGINPRSRELAAEWRRMLGDDEAVIRQMLNHFRQQAFIYTLTPPLLGKNSIDEFLFETRRGFCEHYAAAFVFTMRAAGIPARVVTGYQGGEHNPVDGYLIVRQSDAHAWAEAWIAKKGWVRVDPTAAIAPTRIEAGLASASPEGYPIPFIERADLAWLRELRFRWEAMNNSWNQWVLGYNPQRQRELLSRLGMHEPDWKGMTAALAVICGLLMLALTAWTLHRRIRLDPVLRAWNGLSRKLGRDGLARHTWEGPSDYARRVARARPQLAAAIERIAALYIALRYDQKTSSTDDGKELLRELKHLIAEMPPCRTP